MQRRRGIADAGDRAPLPLATPGTRRALDAAFAAAAAEARLLRADRRACWSPAAWPIAATLAAFIGDPLGEGLHDPRCCPTRTRSWPASRRARAAGERVLVFGDFDADGLTGLAIMVRALRASGWTPSPTCRAAWTRATACRCRAVERPQAAGRTLIVTVDCGIDQRRRDRRGRRGAGSTSSSPTTTAMPPVLPPAAGDRQPAPRRQPSIRTRAWPAAASRSRSPSCSWRTSPAARTAALGLADLATIGTVADVAPIVGENRAIARLGPGAAATRRAARAGGAPRARRSRPPATVDLETVAFVIAPADQRRRPGRRRAGGRPPAADRRPGRGQPSWRPGSRRPTWSAAT